MIGDMNAVGPDQRASEISRDFFSHFTQDLFEIGHRIYLRLNGWIGSNHWRIG
jgi:hypothetical protein